MKNKLYEFTVKITGRGENVEDAWMDALYLIGVPESGGISLLDMPNIKDCIVILDREEE